MTRLVTLAMLREHGACDTQFRLFERLFGAEVVPTLELCIQHADDFDWSWAVYLLPEAAVRDAVWLRMSEIVEARGAAADCASDRHHDGEISLAQLTALLARGMATANQLRAEAWFEAWEAGQ